MTIVAMTSEVKYKEKKSVNVMEEKIKIKKKIIKIEIKKKNNEKENE